MSASFDNSQFLILAKKWPAVVLKYLHKHFYHRLVHISRQRTNNHQAAEDIVQEVFIDVWRNLDRLIKQDGFLIAPYLLMLVKNKSITFYRKSSITRNFSQEALTVLASSSPTAEDLLLTKDASHQLRVMIATLPRREGDCVRLKFIDGLSNDAVADRLGVSKKTVEKRVKTAIGMLRKIRGRI